MASGAVFQVGEQKIRPGVYVRVTSSGGPAVGAVPQGIVAALFRSSWGQTGQAVVLENIDAVLPTFGSDGTVNIAQENFRGGCRQVLGYRTWYRRSESDSNIERCRYNSCRCSEA